MQPTPPTKDPKSTDPLPLWDELRRIADELEVKIHLASMEARDQWALLKPRLADVEHQVAKTGQAAGQALGKELASLGDALRRLRDDIRKSVTK